MRDSPGTPTSPLLSPPLAHSSPIMVSWLVTGFMAGYCYGLNCVPLRKYTGFPGGSVVKNPPANPGDTGLIPALGRSPGEGNGTPLQYSSLENSMDKVGYSPWVHKELHMTEQLSTHTISYFRQQREPAS